MTTFKKATKTYLNIKESEIRFSVDSKIYSKDVIFKACYALIDKIYVFLDSPVTGELVVYLKTKKKATQKQLEKLRDEFLNELLNVSIRKNVSQKNQKAVEHIIGGAINAALTKQKVQHTEHTAQEDEDIQEIEKEIAALKKELEADMKEGDYDEDPLDIRKPIA